LDRTGLGTMIFSRKITGEKQRSKGRIGINTENAEEEHRGNRKEEEIEE
jgi:hypothetical protein